MVSTARQVPQRNRQVASINEADAAVMVVAVDSSVVAVLIGFISTATGSLPLTPPTDELIINSQPVTAHRMGDK